MLAQKQTRGSCLRHGAANQARALYCPSVATYARTSKRANRRAAVSANERLRVGRDAAKSRGGRERGDANRQHDALPSHLFAVGALTILHVVVCAPRCAVATWRGVAIAQAGRAGVQQHTRHSSATLNTLTPCQAPCICCLFSCSRWGQRRGAGIACELTIFLTVCDTFCSTLLRGPRFRPAQAVQAGQASASALRSAVRKRPERRTDGRQQHPNPIGRQPWLACTTLSWTSAT